MVRPENCNYERDKSNREKYTIETSIINEKLIPCYTNPKQIDECSENKAFNQESNGLTIKESTHADLNFEAHVCKKIKIQSLDCNQSVQDIFEHNYRLKSVEKHCDSVVLDSRPDIALGNFQDNTPVSNPLQTSTSNILCTVLGDAAVPGDKASKVFDKVRESHKEKMAFTKKKIHVGTSRNRLTDMIFLFCLCCLIIVEMSDGPMDYENMMAFNFVMGFSIVIRHLVLSTRKGGFRSNVSLIFGILKSLQGGTDIELEFSKKNRCLCPGDKWISTKKVFITESPLVNLGAPGPSAYKTCTSREETFRRVYNLPVSASVLAQQGFYWNGQQAQCYGCNSTHAVYDLAQSPQSSFWHTSTCHLHNRHGNYRTRLRQVASDTPGRISDDVRDPPGQQSKYIPPGDVRLESYRLSTFNSYPVHSPMDRRVLAKGGFYFTGYGDRVKCFACGRTVERWESGDNPMDLMWHKDSCSHPRGGECGNVPITNLLMGFQGPRNQRPGVSEQRDSRTGSQNPGSSEPQSRGNVTNTSTHRPPTQWRMANVISSDHRRFVNNLYLNRELDRLVSFARWPTGRPTVSPTDLARNGFFYLGDMDRTQCFSCAGVLRNWTAEDSALVEHQTHFPNCRFVLGTETRNVPVPMQPESPQERRHRFPCRFPSNPHMRSEATRLDTFDSRWPMGRMAATPEEIARSGFFFLGERDRVKCWYCNGGLQHWDYDDAPWVEHAKWFPNCQFLLSVKGQHFVYRHLTTSAYLSRPIIARQEGASVDPNEQGSNEPPEDIPPPSTGTQRGQTPPPTIVDPREETRKKEEIIENALKESDIVKNVLAMGFSTDTLRIVLREKLDAGEVNNTTDIYETVSGLLDAVMQKETEEEQQRLNEAASLPVAPYLGSGKHSVPPLMDEDDNEDEDMYSAGQFSSMNSVTQAKQTGTNSEQSSASLQEALKKIEEERMCKICFANQADMVFIPCGHMCCCRECTEAIRHCPVCRVRIEKAIKTYLE